MQARAVENYNNGAFELMKGNWRRVLKHVENSGNPQQWSSDSVAPDNDQPARPPARAPMPPPAPKASSVSQSSNNTWRGKQKMFPESPKYEAQAEGH